MLKFKQNKKFVKKYIYEKLYSLNLKLYNSKIPLEPYQKFLGTTFDPKLSFNKEAECIMGIMKQRINMLKILKSKRNVVILIKLFFTRLQDFIVTSEKNLKHIKI